MSNRRIPGSTCSTRVASGWIDAGTSERTRTPKPGPVCGYTESVKNHLVIPADVPGRLLLAARAGLPNLSQDVREKVGQLLTLQNMAFFAAAIVVDMLANGTVVGLAVNVTIGAATVVFLGLDAVKGFRNLATFYELGARATSEEDFKRAGAAFSSAITTLGVDTILILLAHRAGKKMNGEAEPVRSTADIQAAWFAFIDRLEFKVAENQGILWSKIGVARVLQIAAEKGSDFKVLEMFLEENGFKMRYDEEFGKLQSELTYRIWERLSMKYVSSLRGQVTVYVERQGFNAAIRASKEGALPVGRGGGAWKPPMPALVTEIEEAIESNPSITSIKMIDEATKQVIGVYFRGMVGHS